MLMPFTSLPNKNTSLLYSMATLPALCAGVYGVFVVQTVAVTVSFQHEKTHRVLESEEVWLWSKSIESCKTRCILVGGSLIPEPASRAHFIESKGGSWLIESLIHLKCAVKNWRNALENYDGEGREIPTWGR
jgi:hypothetical protein